jgi:hypothetical protein
VARAIAGEQIDDEMRELLSAWQKRGRGRPSTGPTVANLIRDMLRLYPERKREAIYEDLTQKLGISRRRLLKVKQKWGAESK